ncbi:MAG TPA: adenylate/guanylate cyclase domain-containing protein [Clostridia bacterium]|nr:adenylate/guanylate cyclase domain-containing protein [Clostridia bacterium]HRX41192.1 adenylate/guanylate cyclase domain-containing protein [Clostridia bacterium]
MICFNCGYKLNSPDAENCKVCGIGFPFKCSKCGNPNPKLARFCLSCGTGLDARGEEEETADKLSENRKNVAVIFADISRFTAISEKLDPEEVRSIINNCFQYITKPVYELEGTIDKYMGDCVMILFGARYAHNDDPMRAVKCAMRMMKRIEEFSTENFGKLGTELGLSIGINYGLVVTGRVGNYYDDDYTVMGDVVNTAQRLQVAAGRGNILVSESVFEETNDLIHYSEGKRIHVKNKENEVECYSPISLSVKNTAEGQLVPRMEELDFINRAYSGRSQVNHVVITGESGLGKTTLVKTFLTEKGDEIKQILIGCSTVLRERPYSTISSIISGILNIDPNDSTRIKTNRLKSFLDYILRDYNEETIIRNYNFLALVMGLERDGEFIEIINAMEYSDLTREMKTQVSLFFSNLDKRQNMVVVVDDMHLADMESLEILQALDSFPGFFIFISQYIKDSMYEFKNILDLKRFSPGETESLISIMLDIPNINPGFTENIFEITDGNPMFIHEIVQTIRRKNLFSIKGGEAVISEEALDNLPRNLKSTILRNLSDIGRESMEFLNIASVAGNSFNLSWVLDAMSSAPDENEVMRLPLKMNIIEFTAMQKTSETSDRIYSFTQDTIRKVIYDTLLNEDKHRYHSAIAERIEAKFRKELENYYEILGFHYLNAGIPRLAKKYYLKSADKLKSNYIYKSALEYYDKYIELEDVSDHMQENTELVNAFISKSEILINISEYEQAVSSLELAGRIAVQGENINRIKLLNAMVMKETARYEEALSILDQVEPMLGKSSNLFGKALQLRCAIYIVMGKPGVIDLVKESEKILLKSRDYSSLAETMSHAGIKHFFSGNPGEAIEYFEKALDYAKRSNNQGVISKVSINLGIIYHATGETDKSFIYLSNSMEASEKISNIKSYLSAEINLGIFYMEKGLFSKAVSMFDDAIGRSMELGLFYQACLAFTNKADVEYEIGNYMSSKKLYEQSLEIAKKYSMSVEMGLNYLGIAKAEISMEEYDGVRELLDKSFEIFKESEEIPSIGDFHYYKSIFHYDNGEFDESLSEVDKAIETASRTGEDVKLTKAVRKKGDILMKLGIPGQAGPEYEKSVTLSEETGSFYEMAKSHFSNYKYLSEMNDKKRAKESLEKARQYITQIDYCKWTNSIVDEIY